MHEKIFNNMHTSLIHGRNPGKFSEMAQATTFDIIFSQNERCWELWNSYEKFISKKHNKQGQGYGFSSGHVWMWELDCEESWALNNWCFWTVVLEKTPQLEKTLPWTARRSNQSILKEISPGCSLQGLMLRLTLQYFGHFMRRVDSLQKTLMLGGIGGRRRREQ